MNNSLYRAKRTDSGEWVEGYLFRLSEELNPFIMLENKKGTSYEVDPSTICKCTGKEYMDSVIAYEGDVFESQASGDLMILRYGIYQAYCPVDKEYMDSLGFYAECKGYADMPIGDLHDYALRKGNIFDNPELLEVSL